MRKRKVEREFPPILHSISRRVRFEEVDQLSIMWHGRYASWFEDGREAMSEEFGISALTFYDNKVVIPLKHFSIDFHAPLLYKKVYTIESSLMWNEAAIIEFEYKILDENNVLMTKGTSIQMMLDLEMNLLIEAPEFYKEFCEKWKKGLIKNPPHRGRF